MALRFPPSATILLIPLLTISVLQNPPPARPQEKGEATSTAAESRRSGEERTNPITPTPESLAEAKKVFGYDCAMCHGSAGNGKGDLAASMGLKLSDWHDSSKLAALSDGELFEVIVKGKGRMIGEGDRYPVETVWKLVNYIRGFEKKETATTTKPASQR